MSHIDDTITNIFFSISHVSFKSLVAITASGVFMTSPTIWE